MDRAARQEIRQMTKREAADKAQGMADYTNDLAIVIKTDDGFVAREAHELFGQDLAFYPYILVVRPTGDERYDGLSAAQMLAKSEYDLTTQEQPR
jgi:hypothetical protein